MAATTGRGDWPLYSEWLRVPLKVPWHPIWADWFFDEAAGPGEINATAAQAIGAISQATTAGIPVQAAPNQALGPFTQATSAKVIISAGHSITLGGVAQTATSQLTSTLNATANQTLAAITQAASARVIIGATAGHSIAPVIQTATMARVNSATAALTIGAISLVARSMQWFAAPGISVVVAKKAEHKIKVAVPVLLEKPRSIAGKQYGRAVKQATARSTGKAAGSMKPGVLH